MPLTYTPVTFSCSPLVLGSSLHREASQGSSGVGQEGKVPDCLSRTHEVHCCSWCWGGVHSVLTVLSRALCRFEQSSSLMARWGHVTSSGQWAEWFKWLPGWIANCHLPSKTLTEWCLRRWLLYQHQSLDDTWEDPSCLSVETCDKHVTWESNKLLLCPGLA